MAHTSVQENNFNIKTASWENYARYGSYYLYMLNNMWSRYAELNGLLENKEMSVQAQNRYPLRTAIEQTVNHDAKQLEF